MSFLRDKIQIGMRKGTVLLLLVLSIIGCIVFAPLSVVWAISTLSGTPIQYTFSTWAAAAVLIGIMVLAAKL